MAQGYVLIGLCNVDHKTFHIWRKTSASESDEHLSEQRKCCTTISVPKIKVKLSLCIIMKEYGTVEVQIHLLLNSKRVIGQLQFPLDLPAGRETLDILKLETESATAGMDVLENIKSLFPSLNRTTSPRSSRPQPSHYTDYVTRLLPKFKWSGWIMTFDDGSISQTTVSMKIITE